MNITKRILSAFLICVFCLYTCISSYAADASQTDGTQAENELTEEEKKMKEELDKAYSIPAESNAWEGWAKGPGTYGEAAIVMEADTGTILYAKDIDSRQYPASITKILTALLALENAQMTDQVVFSHDCVSFLQPGDSSVGLKEGNIITMEQALYATLLASANEAAYAVAENTGKNAGYDYNWFIQKMNSRTKELGGVNSNFVNPNGLHDANHYTCARDMALIGCELFKYPEFFQIVQTLEYKIPKSDTVEEHVFQQKDKMLRPQNVNYYKYAVGGKTGYTSDALSTLITMADNGKMKLVCVVLRTHGKNVYPDTTNLLNYAFKKFKKIQVSEFEQSQDVEEILEEEGNAFVVVPKKAEFTDLAMEIRPDGVGSEKGTLVYTYHGNQVGSVKARLSEQYLEANSLKAEDVTTEDIDSEDSAKETEISDETDESEGFLKELLQRICDMNVRERIILGVLAALFFVLCILFIIFSYRYRKRKKKRKK